MLTSDLTDFYHVLVFWWVVISCYLHTSYIFFFHEHLCCTCQSHISSTKLSNHNLLVSHLVTLPSFWLVLGTSLWIFLHNLELGWLLLHVLVNMRVCCLFLHDKNTSLFFSYLFLSLALLDCPWALKWHCFKNYMGYQDFFLILCSSSHLVLSQLFL